MSSITHIIPLHATLSGMPVEVIIMIMKSAGEPRDILGLAQSCNRLYQIMKNNEASICREILEKTHHPPLYLVARANAAASKLENYRLISLMPGPMEKWCAKYLDRTLSPLDINRDEFTLKSAIYMDDFHDLVTSLTERFTNNDLKSWQPRLPILRKKQPYQGPATAEERVRIMKAFYIIELVSKVAPTTHRSQIMDGEDVAKDLNWEIFWRNFAPWESCGVNYMRLWVAQLSYDNAPFLANNLAGRSGYFYERAVLFQGLLRIATGRWKPICLEQWDLLRRDFSGCPRYWFPGKKLLNTTMPAMWTGTMAETDALEKYGVDEDDKGMASQWFWLFSIHSGNFRDKFYTPQKNDALMRIMESYSEFSLMFTIFWGRDHLKKALGLRLPTLKAMKEFAGNVYIGLEENEP